MFTRDTREAGNRSAPLGVLSTPALCTSCSHQADMNTA